MPDHKAGCRLDSHCRVGLEVRDCAPCNCWATRFPEAGGSHRNESALGTLRTAFRRWLYPAMGSVRPPEFDQADAAGFAVSSTGQVSEGDCRPRDAQRFADRFARSQGGGERFDCGLSGTPDIRTVRPVAVNKHGSAAGDEKSKNWQDSLVFCEEENGAAWNVAVWVRSWRSSAIPRNQTTAGKPSLTSETSPPPEGNSNNSGGIFLSACPPVWKPSTAGMSGKHPWEQRRSGGTGQFVRCNWFGLVDPAKSPWGSCRGDGHRADHLYCRCPQGHESQCSADPRITCGLSSFLPDPADSRG